MSKKLFVGNLPFDVNDADLATVLGVAGKVESAKIVVNNKTGRSKGYGFVEMATEEMAKEAVAKFEGATLNERPITVQIASPKMEEKAKAEEKAEETAAATEQTGADATVAASTEAQNNG
jgi:RNA recognition motif-containing protein